MIAPEFATVETFVQFLLDDERDTFTPGEAQKIAEATRRPMTEIVEELKSYGLKVSIKHKQAEGRGINSNNHDKYSAKNGWVTGCGIGGSSRHMVSHWQPT